MTRFWVGNGGNWDDTAHWAVSSGGVGGASVPTSADDVVFDFNSFSSSGQVVSIRNAHTNNCKTLDASNVTNLPTLQFISTSGGSTAQLTTVNNVTIPAGTFAISVSVPSLTNAIWEITSTSTFSVHPSLAGLTLLIDGAFSLGDDLVVGSLTQQGGSPSFTTNNHNFTFTTWEIQQGTVNLGSSILTQTVGTAGNLVGLAGTITLQNVGNVTLNAGTSVLNMSSNGGLLQMLNAGANTTLHFNDIHFTISARLTTATTGFSLTFNNFTVDLGQQVTFTNGTFVVNGTLHAIGGPLNPCILTGTATWFINSPTNSVLVDYVNVKNSTASGITPFVSAGGTDLGGNTNWTFPAIVTQTKTQLGKARISAIQNKTIQGRSTILTPGSVSLTPGDTTHGGARLSGNAPILNCSNQQVGIVYSTNPNPTTSDNNVIVTTVVGPFTVDIEGLLPGITYYVRPYFLCSGVPHYGQQVIMTTPAVSAIQLPATDNLVGPYEWQILDASNNLVADLSGYIFNRRFVIERNRPGEMTFSISLFTLNDLCTKLHTTAPNLFQTGIYTLRIVRKKQIITAGQLDYWETDFTDPTNPVVNVKAHGWLKLLSYRVFSGEYISRDANYIIRDMVTQTQLLTNGDFLITLGTSATGTNSYADKIIENKSIMDEMIALSEEANGIDFAFTWDKVLNLYWPHSGQQRNDILFTYPGNTLGMNISMDSTKLINNLLARGQGNAGANISTIIADPTSQGIYKQRQAVIDFPDINSADQIVAMAGAELQFYKNPLQLHSVIYNGVDPACPVVGSYNVGDSINVAFLQLQLFAPFNGTFIIDKQTVQLGNEDQETVQLDLNNPPA